MRRLFQIGDILRQSGVHSIEFSREALRPRPITTNAVIDIFIYENMRLIPVIRLASASDNQDKTMPLLRHLFSCFLHDFVSRYNNFFKHT